MNWFLEFYLIGALCALIMSVISYACFLYSVRKRNFSLKSKLICLVVTVICASACSWVGFAFFFIGLIYELLKGFNDE